MAWFLCTQWSDGIKKRACRYLLQRYLGQFLEEKLSLDQLSVNIYNGTGSVSNVSLDVQALNDMGEQKNLPVEFVDGFISDISVSIPWATLLKDSIFIEVSGMQITIQPRQRIDNGESMLESMWSSVASSMQLATECLKGENTLQEDKDIDSANSMEGLEIFAQTIESVLTRVKIKFVGTTLRFEHVPKEGKNGIALEIRAKIIEYCDETSCEEEGIDVGSAENQTSPLFNIKKFHCDGITFYTDEFPVESRTFSRSISVEDEAMNKSFEKDESTPILFGKMLGIQEIRLKSKKKDNTSPGPKFDLEFSLGSLSLFLSPRQLYLLIEIVNSLTAPHTQDSTNVNYKKSGERLLNADDYKNIEQDLHDTLNLHNFHSHAGKAALGKGWVSTSVEESDDEFFPMGPRQSSSQSASLYSNNTDVSWETSASAVFNKADVLHSYSSSNFGSSSYNEKHEKKNVFDYEVNGETTVFQVRLSSVAIVMLHEDILTFDVDTYSLTSSSVSTMNNISLSFFEHLAKFTISGFGNKDFEAWKSVFHNACSQDHLRILGAAFVVEGKEGGDQCNRFCTTKISAGSFELLECLFEPNSEEPQYVELLKFMKTSHENPVQPHFPLSNQPDIRIYIAQTTKIRPSHIYIKTEVTFSLQQCWSEIDLSLYDRLVTIFSSQSLCHVDVLSKGLFKNFLFEPFESATITDRHLAMKVQCPFLVIKFRFPIPDLRPDIEKGRYPWWKRSIRKDVLYLNLVDALFQTESSYTGIFLEYNLQCSQITMLFQEGDSDMPIPFLYAAPVDANDTSTRTFYEFPRLSVKVSAPRAIDEIEDIGDKEDIGLTCSFMETPIKESSPFASKRFVYNKSDMSSGTACEGEEIITPANKANLNTFVNEALENSKFQIDIILPYIHIDFSSKHLYEVLYNRSSDVSLWQSSVSKITPMNMQDGSNIFPKGFKCTSFSLCKSGLQLGEEESEDENESCDQFSSSASLNFKMNSSYHLQSNLGLKIQITSGDLTICPNLKDSKGNIVPEKHGQLRFVLDKTNIFTVTNHKGISQNNYICFQVEKMSLLHKAIIDNANDNSHNKSYFNKPLKSLKPIIYKTKVGTMESKLSSIPGENIIDMFTIALSTKVDSRRVKTIRVACGINGATLRHYVTPSEHSWLNQLMDFLDVVDYPVKGYDSPQVITELHLNLEDTSVDYRPRFLQTQSLVYFGNFSISSNIASRTKTSTLRFIAEETNLFISDKITKPNEDINLKKNYISVIDLGLFELSLRLSDQPNQPKVDLKASSDILNIRTCSDSAGLLAQLLTYYASNGDLRISDKINESESNSSEGILDYDLASPSVMMSSDGEVHDMMEDAMKEITYVSNNIKTSNIEGDEVEVQFYFPDEGRKDDGYEVQYDWGVGDLDSDSEFCFIEHETTNPLPPEGSHPVIQILSDVPIQIIDNHFNISVGKTDFLLPPKYYPPPTYRYTLSDMNLVWHMYGGHDLSSTPASKKNVDFDLKEKSLKLHFNAGLEDQLNYHLVNVGTDTINNRKQRRKKRNSRGNKWYTVGGSGRKHDVLMQLYFSKVRFQHEIYPDRATQASRQVLLIHNFEIRDKLITSQINKFLYQYTSESNPRQSNANMVMVKAVHIRPDTRRDVQETCLKVSMLPLRLNIDQDSIEFLYGFVCELSSLKTKGAPEVPPTSCKPNSKSDFLDSSDKEIPRSPKTQSRTQHSQPPIYIRNFIFSPEVPIRIDYEGKRVNMTHGPMAGIIMGIGQLNCLQIKLKRLCYKHGLLGFDKLVNYAFTEWIQDIKKTQFPCLIGGVGPMHALFQLFLGIKDLFWLPIEQYQKDGRIFRGIQRGANSFTTSTVIAALELTARIVQAIQSIAEAAFDMVSPGPSVRRIHGNKSKKPHRYSHPIDIREGVTNAYALVKDGLGETAEALVRVASSEAEQKGAVGAVGGVLRQIPPSMVAPIIIASAATSNLLGGVRNQLAPDSRREASFKWKVNDT